MAVQQFNATGVLVLIIPIIGVILTSLDRFQIGKIKSDEPDNTHNIGKI